MNATHGTAFLAPPFRLETFGTLSLQGPEEPTLVADHGQQGRRLALLAVLAASGERGTSRDRLLLLFWPDASQQRARHALEQTLYKARRSLNESLFAGVNPLRLNPAVVTSDVADFERALGAGDLEAAVGHYRGAFLDGFYLSDAPEFDEWVNGERTRLEVQYTEALERLAQTAEDASDNEAAIRWHRRLCETDSLSSRYAVGLIRALANAGDHASALRHAEQYERLVEQELGTNMSPEITALTGEIRARTNAEHAGKLQSAPRDSTSERGPSVAPAASPKGATAPVVAGRTASRPLHRIALYAIAVLTLAVAVFAAMRLRDSPGEGPTAAANGPSIAVLPLTNLSMDPGDATLADGLTQELIAMLSRSGDLRVVASTSVFALKDRGMDVRQIADTLRVSHVLEGGFQKVASRLRVQVRLVDARDGSTRWSETYDREMGDIFAVQEDIARAVARELDAQLPGFDRLRPSIPRRHTTNIAAYEWYLRGMDMSLMRSDSGRERAIEYLNRAIDADSNYAAAYAGLVRIYALQAQRDIPTRPETIDRIEQAALKSVTLDDSLAEAHHALGFARMGQWRFSSAEAEFKRAIALDPQSPLGHEGLAHLYYWTGRPVEQLAEARLALEADPFSYRAVREVGRALLVNGRCDEALHQVRPLKELNPPAGVAGVIGGQCYAMKEMWPEAIAEFRWAVENSGRSGSAFAFLGYALAREGRREEATRILSDLLSGRENSSGAFGIAIVYAGLKDYDQAFAWLEKGVGERSINVNLMSPVFEELHRDPRFARLKERIGLQNR